MNKVHEAVRRICAPKHGFNPDNGIVPEMIDNMEAALIDVVAMLESYDNISLNDLKCIGYDNDDDDFIFPEPEGKTPEEWVASLFEKAFSPNEGSSVYIYDRNGTNELAMVDLHITSYK